MRLLPGALSPFQRLHVVGVADAEPCARGRNAGVRQGVVGLDGERLLEVADGFPHRCLGVVHQQAAPAKVEIVGGGIIRISDVQPGALGRRQLDAQRHRDLFGDIVLQLEQADARLIVGASQIATPSAARAAG